MLPTLLSAVVRSGCFINGFSKNLMPTVKNICVVVAEKLKKSKFVINEHENKIIFLSLTMVTKPVFIYRGCEQSPV